MFNVTHWQQDMSLSLEFMRYMKPNVYARAVSAIANRKACFFDGEGMATDSALFRSVGATVRLRHVSDPPNSAMLLFIDARVYATDGSRLWERMSDRDEPFPHQFVLIKSDPSVLFDMIAQCQEDGTIVEVACVG